MVHHAKERFRDMAKPTAPRGYNPTAFLSGENLGIPSGDVGIPTQSPDNTSHAQRPSLKTMSPQAIHLQGLRIPRTSESAAVGPANPLAAIDSTHRCHRFQASHPLESMESIELPAKNLAAATYVVRRGCDLPPRPPRPKVNEKLTSLVIHPRHTLIPTKLYVLGLLSTRR